MALEGEPLVIADPSGSSRKMVLPETIRLEDVIDPSEYDVVELPKTYDEHVDMLATLGQSDLPHYMRDNNPFRSFVTKEHFEEKYSGASTDDLVVSKARLEIESQKLGTLAMDDYFDSGSGESSLVESSVPWSEDAPRPKGKKSYGLVQVAKSQPFGTQLLQQRGELPWDRYTALYDLKDELSWVNRELWRRGKELKERLLAESEAAVK
jgi:hypothetical protein